MRERNWSEYNRQLIQRGSLTFLIDQKFLKKLKPKRSNLKGRPTQYALELIELLAIVKVHFKLTYRSLQGFANSFLSKVLPEGKSPDYTLICKRIIQLGKCLPKLPSNRGGIVALDASGMKVYGEGEWKVKVHGRGRPRKWVKVHLAIDVETQEIVAEVVTESKIGDSKMTGFLLDQMTERPKKVLADGGYDKQEARGMITKRKIEQVIPPPRNARYRGNNSARDRAIAEIVGLGGDKNARSLWGKLTGYNMRVLAETMFSRLKRLFGERFFSKSIEKQRVESRIRCYLINKMKVARA